MSTGEAMESISKADEPTPTSTRKRRRRGKDKNAPIQPANCFTRFMMARRQKLIVEHPELSHIDVSKKLGEEWKAMSPQEKEIYMREATADREAYTKELAVYKKTDAYKTFRKKLSSKTQIKKRDNSKQQRDEAPLIEDSPFDIPIFSKEFLELNRQRESELRRLRMEAVRLEEEEKALNSNIERLQKATGQLETEFAEQKQTTNRVRTHLDSYRKTLVQAFAHMPFPGTGTVPTMSTIDWYMSGVHKLIVEAPGEHQDFLAKVRDIVTQLRMPASA